MAVRLPTLEQIDNLGSDFGLVLSADEVAAYQQAFKGPLASYGRLDELVPPSLAPIAPRSPGYRPSASENPYGAWYWKTNIQTGPEGLLTGKKVAIKDNICVSGVPMMNGSVLLEGYVPGLDADQLFRRSLRSDGCERRRRRPAIDRHRRPRRLGHKNDFGTHRRLHVGTRQAGKRIARRN